MKTLPRLPVGVIGRQVTAVTGGLHRRCFCVAQFDGSREGLSIRAELHASVRLRGRQTGRSFTGREIAFSAAVESAAVLEENAWRMCATHRTPATVLSVISWREGAHNGSTVEFTSPTVVRLRAAGDVPAVARS
jgi:hypothetical protein